MSRWAYRGFLCDISVEWPKFFKLGEKWVLITSPHNPVHYYIGSFDTERLTFEAETEGRIEETRTFYGTNVLFDDELRCMFLGRLRRNKEDTTWNGCMALPRILTIGPEGHPRQVPVPELQKLRGKHHGISDVTLTGASRAIDGANSDTLEIIAQLELNDAACFGLKVRCSPDAIGAVAIRYDRQTLTKDSSNENENRISDPARFDRYHGEGRPVARSARCPAHSPGVARTHGSA